MIVTYVFTVTRGFDFPFEQLKDQVPLKVLSGQILFANSNLQDEKIIPVEKQNSNSPPRVVSASSNNSM